MAAVVGNDDGAMLGTITLGLNDGRKEGLVVTAGIVEGVNGVSAVESTFGADVTTWVGAADGVSVENGASTTIVVNVGDALGVSVGGRVVATVGDEAGACGPTDTEGASASSPLVSAPSLVVRADAEVCCSSSNTDWLWK